jgi:hypothetical protein
MEEIDLDEFGPITENWREQCAVVRREYECLKIYEEVVGVFGKPFIPSSSGVKGTVNMVISGVNVGTSQFTVDKQN